MSAENDKQEVTVVDIKNTFCINGCFYVDWSGRDPTYYSSSLLPQNGLTMNKQSFPDALQLIRIT
ncbi:TPA: hypothetical protein ACMD20_001299 [Vibrio parahaemolyticus]